MAYVGTGRTCYIVAFEIAQPTHQLAMIARLKAYGTFCPVNATCWALVTDQTAAQVRDNLMAAIPASDKIFVVRSGTEAAWRTTYGDKHSEWLKNHL